MNPEKLLAALALLVCAVMLLRLVVAAPHRERFDRALSRTWQKMSSLAIQLVRWPTRRRQARQGALDAIARAQRQPKGQWKGNVYTPDSFSGHKDGDTPSKRDLH